MSRDDLDIRIVGRPVAGIVCGDDAADGNRIAELNVWPALGLKLINAHPVTFGIGEVNRSGCPIRKKAVINRPGHGEGLPGVDWIVRSLPQCLNRQKWCLDRKDRQAEKDGRENDNQRFAFHHT